MISEEKLKAAINVITQNILTPVIYMYEDEVTEFICFSDSNAPQEDFDNAERMILDLLGIQCEIIDIRAFSEHDRVEILNNAETVYAADIFVKFMFESAMRTDLNRLIESRSELISRYRQTGTYYVS